jgi:hypothetical protein
VKVVNMSGDDFEYGPNIHGELDQVPVGLIKPSFVADVATSKARAFRHCHDLVRLG